MNCAVVGKIRRRRFAAALCLALTGIACEMASAQGMPPSAVRVDEAVIENVRELRRVTGDLRAVARSRVATTEGGLVMTLPVVEGQTVEKGDILATLDCRRLDLQLQRIVAEEQVFIATLAEREADAELSRNDLEMLRTLDDRKASNPKELADAVSQVKADEARRDQAQFQLEVIRAQVELLQIRIADTKIAAPYDGVIVQKHSEVGEWIGEGDPVLEMVAIGSFDAWLDIPQRFAKAIIGKDITIAVSIAAINRQFEPRSPRIIRLVDPKARSFSAVVRLEDEDNILAPGMSVIGWAPTGNFGDRLTIDKDALLKNPTGYYIYVVREDMHGGLMSMPVNVNIEFDLGPRLVISSGTVKPGDRVIVEGNERLFPTAPVMISTVAHSEVSRK